MASTTSTPLARRKKQTVYGKSTTKPNSGIFQDDEVARSPVVEGSKKYTTAPQRPAQPVPPKPIAQPSSPPKKSGALPKAKRSPIRTKDPFDVPSDDEARTEVFVEIPLPPKQQFKSRLLDEPKEETGQLAPWEERAAQKGKLPSSTATRSSRSKIAAHTTDQVPAPTKHDNSARSRMATEETSQAQKEKDTQEDSGMTAMERLSARREKMQAQKEVAPVGQVESTKDITKRSVGKTSAREALHNKRRRVTPQPTSPIATEDVVEPTGTITPDVVAMEDSVPTANGDIFDVPSDDETARPAKPFASARRTKPSQGRGRPGALRKVTPQKGLSAPSRLQDMISSEDEHGFPIVDSTSSEKPATPQTALRDTRRPAPSTPDSGRSSASHDRKPGTLTPKQTQLWAELLEPLVGPATGMKKLSIAEGMWQKKPEHGDHATLNRSSSDVPVKRTRVIDRLRASAPNSSDEESEDEVMGEEEPITASFVAKPRPNTTTGSQETGSVSQTSQSQDKHAKPTASGSLITYAKQRSHLADDSIESAFMLDVPMDDVPERPAAISRRVGRSAASMQSNSYDMDDLDDAPTAGLRTIHELRAEGRNARVMGEIEDLIGEIRDHETSARSRRRGALLDLTTKLFDRGFAEQIISHGFENALLAEFKTSTDPPADFLLVASHLLLMHSEPPSHALNAFEEFLPCISRLLAEPTDIAKVVKERRSNMTKVAQGDLIALSDKMRTNTELWGQIQPTTISSRVVALKTIELVVRKLRDTGNKSDILDDEALNLLTTESTFTGLHNNPGKAFEATLVISILEALKTLSAGDNWPHACIKSIAALPGIFAQEWQAPPDSKWIAYRLCANITNESGFVQSAFVETDAVTHLMGEVVAGFDLLHNSPVEEDVPEADAKRDFDILVLAIAALINLTEHSTVARQQAVNPVSLDSLTSIVRTFIKGQEQELETVSAEQLEQQSAANVAYGYLSIMLANICQDDEAREVIRGLLPGDKMDVLVAVVEEFVKHHQKVDGQQSGEPKQEWSNFTERLLGVLAKLKAGQGSGNVQV